MRRVAYLNIAPGKTVEVITLIDKAYLIGVTEDNISLLGEIDDKELITITSVTDKNNSNVTAEIELSLKTWSDESTNWLDSGVFKLSI